MNFSSVESLGCHPQEPRPQTCQVRRAERSCSPPLPARGAGEDFHIPPLYSPPSPRDSRRQILAAIQFRPTDKISPREHRDASGLEIPSFRTLCKLRSVVKSQFDNANLPALQDPLYPDFNPEAIHPPTPATVAPQRRGDTCFLSASKAALMVCTRVRSLALARSLRVCCRALISVEAAVASPGRFLGDAEESGWLL